MGHLLLVFHKDCNLTATAFPPVLVAAPSIFLPSIFVSFLPFATANPIDRCCPFSLVYEPPQSGNLVGLFIFLVSLDDLRRRVLGLHTDVMGADSDHIGARFGIAVEDLKLTVKGAARIMHAHKLVMDAAAQRLIGDETKEAVHHHKSRSVIAAHKLVVAV